MNRETNQPFDADNYESESEEAESLRARELRDSFFKNPTETLTDILFRSITRAEFHAKRRGTAINLSTIAQATRMLADIAGVSEAIAKDEKIVLPDDPVEATQLLLQLKASGKVKSVQLNDLLNVIGKLNEQQRMKILEEEIEILKSSAATVSNTSNIKTREEYDNQH